MNLVKKRAVIILISAAILFTFHLSLFTLEKEIKIKENTDAFKEAVVVEKLSETEQYERAKEAYEKEKEVCSKTGINLSYTYFFPSGKSITFADERSEFSDHPSKK